MMATDMEDSISYYCEMFGFKLRARGTNPKRDMAFLYHDDIPGFEIELMRDLYPGETYAEQGIVNHLAFTVDNIEDARKYYESRGITFSSDTPTMAIDGGKTLFFLGPNRELLQLVEPPDERKS